MLRFAKRGRRVRRAPQPPLGVPPRPAVPRGQVVSVFAPRGSRSACRGIGTGARRQGARLVMATQLEEKGASSELSCWEDVA